MRRVSSLPRWVIRTADFFSAAFFWATDWFAFGFTRRKSGGGVVLVRLDAIGDFVLWLDCARRLREHYADQRITLVANSVLADFARELPYWDEVWSVKVAGGDGIRNPVARWRILRRLAQQGFDRAVQPVFSRDFVSGDSMVRATGARERIGSIGDCSNVQALWKSVADSWYTRLVPARDALTTESERGVEFLHGLGIDDYVPCAASIPVMAPLPASMQGREEFFVVFPGASHPGRCWPVAKFRELITAVQSATGLSPVLCGGPGDVMICDQIAGEFGRDILNLAGKTSLAELVEVIRAARLLISNETSAIHFAAAVSTPSVCLLGGGHFGRFVPYPANWPGIAPVAAYVQMPCFGCNWGCTQPHVAGAAFPCVAAVSVDAVVEAAIRVSGQPFPSRWSVHKSLQPGTP